MTVAYGQTYIVDGRGWKSVAPTLENDIEIADKQNCLY